VTGHSPAEQEWLRDLGQRVTAARHEARISQEVAAELAGMSDDMLRAIEAGRRPPDTLRLAQLALVLRVTVGSLIPPVSLPLLPPRRP
jgi:transcriptional regulator with XRE-family HTH domain